MFLRLMALQVPFVNKLPIATREVADVLPDANSHHAAMLVGRVSRPLRFGFLVRRLGGAGSDDGCDVH